MLAEDAAAAADDDDADISKQCRLLCKPHRKHNMKSVCKHWGRVSAACVGSRSAYISAELPN
jgi:hypothetical protein